MTTHPLKSALLLISGFALATGLFAEAPKIAFPAASPASTLKQRIGATDVEIVYSRPGKKGRMVYGGLVPFGEVWRTGANASTKITFTTAVKLNGTDIPAGTYALYTIPTETSWTVIIDKDTSLWGSYDYNPKNDLVRFKAFPVKLTEPVETFTIEFNDIRDDTATLNLIWEKTCVPVKLEVDLVHTLVTQITAAMASAEKKKSGTYLQAAAFYFDQGLDLKQPIAWLDTALADQPKNAYAVLHLKAKILAKLGDKPGATDAANQSLALAAKAGGTVAEEYGKLNNDLLASLH